MKTSKSREKTEESKEENKEKESSETKENIIAIAIFAVLIIIGVGLFTNWFGLINTEQNDNVRINIPLGDDPYIGSVNASVLIIGFSDYECSFCAQGEQVIKSVLKKYKGKVIYVFKDFPLTRIHPNSYSAALAAECAKEQKKYWEYHDYLYEHNDMLEPELLKHHAKDLGLDSERFNECFDTQKYKHEVDKDIETAKNAGVSAAPSFFINGLPLVGAQPLEDFSEIIDAELDK